MPGMTKIDAVNVCLAAINEYRVGALETGGTSIAAEAERYVDRSTMYFCSLGWPCNTRRSVAYTPAAGTGSVTLSDSVVKIKPAGPSSYRTLVMRGNSVYDADKGTNNLGTDPIYLDISELLAFSDLDPLLKEQVAQHAAQLFARRQNGNQVVDAFLTNEMALTDNLQPRQSVFPNAPMTPQAPPQQR